MWTLVIAIVGVVFFLVLSRRGINAVIALRLARGWLAGRVRLGRRGDRAWRPAASRRVRVPESPAARLPGPQVALD